MKTDYLVIDPRGSISDGLVEWFEETGATYLLSPSFGDSGEGWIWSGLTDARALVLDLSALDPQNRRGDELTSGGSLEPMAESLMSLGAGGSCPLIIACLGRGREGAALMQILETSQSCHPLERRFWKALGILRIITQATNQPQPAASEQVRPASPEKTRPQENTLSRRRDSAQPTEQFVERAAAPAEELTADLFQYENIIGVSAPMQKIYDMIDRIAAHDVTVLINGESGTGKELVASCIHYHSSRRQQPFVKLNCAALPETLLESELFGHEKGSFTGAVATKKGKFELADQGTIFLDEIGDMTLSTQVKILRVLQEREFERIGGTGTIKVDVRIITATNRNLPEEIQANRFREDLFYRLNVVNLTLPPLRERKEDIILLAAHFLENYSRKFGKFFRDFDRSAIDVLMKHDWPGNVRELENVIARAVVLAKGEKISSADLPVPVTGLRRNGAQSEDHDPSITLAEARCDFERQFILERLRLNTWNVTRTAATLGLERSNLYRKMKKYGIDKEPNL